MQVLAPSVDCGSSGSVVLRALWCHFVVLGMSGTSGLPTVPAGTALGGGRSASGWGGILCGGRPCFWGMQSVSWAARHAEVALLVPSDEWGSLWPDGEGERFQVGCPVEVGVGLPVDPSLLLPGWPGVVGGTPLPPGAGVSLLGLPSVSRLGVRKYQAWVTFC